MAPDKFAEILARAKAVLAASEKERELAALASIETDIATNGVTDVDLTQMGISDASVRTDEGADAAVDAIREVAANIAEQNTGAGTEPPAATDTSKQIGVAREIVLNAKQSEFNDIVQSGRDVVLIGAAGTGKTTCQRKVTTDAVDSGRIAPLAAGTRWLLAGVPGIAIVSYTNKAVNNIRHAVDVRIRPHVLTIHKLLEFAPVKYEIEDPEKPGEWKTTMRFEPRRNAMNPLPPDLKMLGFEESSMVAVELHQLLMDAMPHQHQKFYLGDIQQLPPVFGLAILGFKMLELPVVELTEIYRQAAMSPIIDLAWKVLEGNPHVFSSRTEKLPPQEVMVQGRKKILNKITCPALDKLSVSNEHGTVKIQVWQQTLPEDIALLTASLQFNTWADQGSYDPQVDIILCPYGKAFGAVEINKRIAQHLGKKRGAKVFEVIAGFEKHYLAIGDRVMYEKEDAFIVDIVRNGSYMGPRPLTPSPELDRWGHYQMELTAEEQLASEADEGIMNTEALEKFMAAAASTVDERVQDSSHVVTVQNAYGDQDTITLDKASQFNGQNLLGGYVITVHKSQGSEWEKVFIVTHATHVKMISRELLYTACTRARKHLHIICETTTFERGVKSQRIKGDTIAEKAEFFKGKEKDYKNKLGKEEEEEKVYGEFQPGVYGGKGVAVAIAPSPEPRKPVKLTPLQDLVPASVREGAQVALDTAWRRATAIWGDKIGGVPALSFAINNSSTLGKAAIGRKIVYLNPVWCIAGQHDAAVREEMLHTTLIHEVCHIVAGNYSGDKAHGAGWKMAMMLMGISPERTYTGDTLPPWTDTMQAIVQQHRQKLEEQGADINAADTAEDGDVI